MKVAFYPAVLAFLLNIASGCGTQQESVGLPCKIDADCADAALVCNLAVPGCYPPAPIGDSCRADTDCEEELRCVGETQDNAGVCGLGLIGEEGACGKDADCEAGYVCDAGLQTCTVPGSVGVGEGCGEDRVCAGGLLCDPTPQTCVEPRSAPLHAPCGRAESCAFGLVCDTESLTCLAAAGEPCAEEDDCLRDDAAVACRPSIIGPPTCTSLGAYGDRCAESEDCASGTCADEGACTGLPSEACDADSLCEPLVCAPDEVGVHQCRVPADEGERCDEDADCDHGACGPGSRCQVAEGAECLFNDDCLLDLVCAPVTGGQRRCTNLVGVCAACDEDRDCASGTCFSNVCVQTTGGTCSSDECCGPTARCMPERLGGAQVCRVYPFGLAAYCEADPDCDTQEGLTCNSAKRCVLSIGSAGCNSTNDCDIGGLCFRGSCALVNAAPEGDVCVEADGTRVPDVCAAPNLCGASGLCVRARQGSTGTSCLSDLECTQGLYCNLPTTVGNAGTCQ